MTAPLRSLTVLAALSVPVLGGCQGLFPDEPGDSIGASRLAMAGSVASTQRQDEDGYPLIGAYPSAAAAQLTDAEVQALDASLNATASSRVVSPGGTGYADRLAQAETARREQAAAVAELGSATSGGRSATSSSPTPEEVLRQIESGE